MNSIKRFLLGLISSALLAVGLARAADRMDPTSSVIAKSQPAVTGTAPDTVTYCHYYDR